MSDAPDSPPPPPVETTSRRSVLGTLAGTAAAAATGLVSLPILVSLGAPVRMRTVVADAAGVDVGEPKDFPPGKPVRISVRAHLRDGWMTSEEELGAVYVVKGEGTWRAYSGTCPHLGCAVDGTGDPDVPFNCPCHDSGFALDGKCLSGPSPRGLDDLPIRELNGRVVVEFKRFRVGGEAKVEV